MLKLLLLRSVFVILFIFSAASQSEIVNISTRGLAGSGDQTMIAGFTITGSESLKVAIIAGGPTLANFGVPNVLADPRLTVYNVAGDVIGSNDNWGNIAEIAALSIAPTNDKEAGIVMTLSPGEYTVHVEGSGNSLGNAIVAVQNIDSDSNSFLSNISTRGIIGVGDERMIVGFVLEGGSQKVATVAIGSGLQNFGISNTISDPMLSLYNAASEFLASNDDWKTGNTTGVIDDITSFAGIQLGQSEAATIQTLAAGSYTIIAESSGGVSGNGLVALDDYATWSQSNNAASGSLGSLTVTGTNSDVFNEHSFAPDSFELLPNGDMKWLINNGADGWALIVQLMGAGSTDVVSVTFSNGWTTESISNLADLGTSLNIVPVEGITITENSITFTNVTKSDRLTLNGTLTIQR